MAKKNDMSAIDADAYKAVPAYPQEFPILAARVLADKLRGRGEHSTAALTHAAWTVLGYAQFSTFGNPEQPLPMNATAPPEAVTDGEAADRLDAMAREADRPDTMAVYGAVPPWMVPFILQLLERFLKG